MVFLSRFRWVFLCIYINIHSICHGDDFESLLYKVSGKILHQSWIVCNDMGEIFRASICTKVFITWGLGLSCWWVAAQFLSNNYVNSDFHEYVWCYIVSNNPNGFSGW